MGGHVIKSRLSSVKRASATLSRSITVLAYSTGTGQVRRPGNRMGTLMLLLPPRIAIALFACLAAAAPAGQTDAQGRFDETVPDYQGMHVFDANPHIIRDLKSRRGGAGANDAAAIDLQVAGEVDACTGKREASAAQSQRRIRRQHQLREGGSTRQQENERKETLQRDAPRRVCRHYPSPV